MSNPSSPHTMTRHGKPLAQLRDGHPRRMADARNAWRKMDDAQRVAFLRDVVGATVTTHTDGSWTIAGQA
jgi:hypothetical protein